MEFNKDASESKISLFNQNYDRWRYSSRYLIKHRLATSPYSLVIHIEAERLNAVRQLKVASGEKVLFDLSTTEIVEWNGKKKLDTGIGYAKFDFKKNYYDPSKMMIVLYFSRIDVTDEKPLRFTFKYLDEKRKLVVENVETKIKKVKDWDHYLTSISV